MPATINPPAVVAQLCADNRRLAFAVAKHFLAHHPAALDYFGSMEDLNSAALVGLVIAARRFELGRVKFASFAWPVIMNSLRGDMRAGHLRLGQIPADVNGAQREPIDHRHVADPLDRVDVCEGLRRLKPRERAVIVGAFVEDQSLAAIGRTMNVTRERARQLHGQALKKLAAYFEG